VTKALPTVVMSNEDYGRITRILADGTDVTLEFNIVNRVYPEGKTSYNTVAEIPGTDKADEVIMLGGHLDSWHAATGATDNAIGSSIMLEAARLIQTLGLKPRRTIRVVLFANEEFGLSGAKEYAKLIGDEHLKHVIAMEADAGMGPIWRLESQVAPEALASLDKIRTVLQPLGIERGENTAHGGSDLGPILSLGVPVLDLAHDMNLYFDVHHTMNDTLAKVDAKTLDQAVAAYAVAAYLAATKQGDFGRLAPVPFTR
jgi:Zn-dependent M28 family amino/carboxypeptidase